MSDEPREMNPDARHRRVKTLYARVLAVQAATLAILWFLQSAFGNGAG